MMVINRYVAVDVETTGLDFIKDVIIEIGALRYENGKVTERFEEFINPGIKLPKKIIQLTNITDDMLLNARNEESVIKDFIDFLGNDILLGHNIIFDYSFLKTAASRYQLGFEKEGIDTLALCGFFHSQMPSKSLESMRILYGISDLNSHRAYYDALASAQIYEKLKEKNYDKYPERFISHQLFYKVKKYEKITDKQKKYLSALLQGHNITYSGDIASLSKSEASRFIDKIISKHGR